MTTAPYRTPDAPAVTPLSDEERNEAALNAVLAAVRDLDAYETRAVLLAVAEFHDLGLSIAEGHDGEPACLSVGDVERILKAARGTP